jgi:outer membrane receptor protein involved in Fe transport
LYTTFAGRQTNAPITVRRADGTMSRRVTFSGPSAQTLTSTDVAVFAQDRWRPGDRWLLDLGARLDRDGVLGVTNVTGRAGVVVALDEKGDAALRGGVGLFYERTPLTVGTFDQFDRATDVRFGADGTTALDEPRTYAPVSDPDLRTPRSLTWSLGYSHRLTSALFARVNLLSRQSRHELIVRPVDARSTLELASDGRSNYREAEFGVRYLAGRVMELHASYTRAAARADANAFGAYFGTIPWRIIGRNEYAVANGDVPHRLVGRLRVTPREDWLVGSVIEWRTGLPFTAVDEFLDPASPRNAYRMPAVTAVDLSVERRFRILGRHPWIGVRVYNALNAHNPADVQRRLDAPDFGATYNSRPRQIRLQLRFQ